MTGPTHEVAPDPAPPPRSTGPQRAHPRRRLCPRVAREAGGSVAQSPLFLKSHVTAQGARLGLGAKDNMARAIPGNHDHWPGTGGIFGPPPHLPGTFPDLPRPVVRIPLSGARHLVIFGIDSDADVRTRGFNRWWARGRFESQLIALEQQVGPPKTNEIRVLLVHHSKGHRSLLGSLMVEKGSRRALEDWVKRAGVSLLLSGHVHLPGDYQDQVSDRGVAWGVLEARCGTTTQLDRLPLNWVRAGTRSDTRLPTNTLLVHRLFDTGSSIAWECELFERVHHGFKSIGPLSNTPGAKPLMVWPRESS